MKLIFSLIIYPIMKKRHSYILETPISNIILYRTCVHSLDHSVDECKGFLSPDKTNATKPLEEEVQKYVTYVSTVKTIIESLAPAFLSLFLGVWSDTHGRKPLIVWPLLGELIFLKYYNFFCKSKPLCCFFSNLK